MKLLTTLFITFSLVSCQMEEAEFFEKEIFEGVQEDNLKEYADNYEDADIDPIDKEDLTNQNNDQQEDLSEAQGSASEEDSSSKDEGSYEEQLANNEEQNSSEEESSSHEEGSQEESSSEEQLANNEEQSSPEEESSPQEEQVADAPNLIINGSFEEGHNLGRNKWNVFASLPGWEINREYADAPIEIQNGPSIGGVSPTDGSAKLELDSHPKKGFRESDASIFQENIPTVAGGVYELSLDYSPRNANRKESNAVEIYFDGQLVAKLMESKRGFITYKFEVNALDNGSRLELRAAKDKDTLGAYLDNVSLVLKNDQFLTMD